MKKYLEHIKSKAPHQRRIHAMQLSTGIVAVVFVAWVATIGVRLATQSPAEVAAQNDASQTASVVQSAQGNATLYVATSTQ